jgi:hypothetical protein
MKSKMMRCVDQVACTKVNRNVYTILIGKPETKKLLEKPKHRWQDNIKFTLKNMEQHKVDSNGSGCEQMVGSCKNSNNLQTP